MNFMKLSNARIRVAGLVFSVVLLISIFWSITEYSYASSASGEQTLQPNEWFALDFTAKTSGQVKVTSENTLNQELYLVALIRQDDYSDWVQHPEQPIPSGIVRRSNLPSNVESLPVPLPDKYSIVILNNVSSATISVAVNVEFKADLDTGLMLVTSLFIAVLCILAYFFIFEKKYDRAREPAKKT